MPNPFDQFDNHTGNAFDRFDKPDYASQIPGNQAPGPAYQDNSTPLDKVIGVGQAAAQAITSMPATIIGGVAGLFGGSDNESRNKIAGDVADKLTYSPSTAKGQEYGEDVGEFANRYLNPLLGGIGHVHIPERVKAGLGESKVSKAFEAEKPKNTFDQFDPYPLTKLTEVNKDVGQLHDQSIVDKLKGLDESINRQDLSKQYDSMDAQQAIEARQAQMEFDVKKQQTIDFNAAERARQEQAPVLPDHAADAQGEAAMSSMADRLTDPRDGQNAQLPPGENPIYVDPQDQAFRGNPAEPNAALGLDRQGAAMDTELTHLRGKDTPIDEPLRPLQDHELNARREEARPLAETPISSKGKRGRQRGAVDLIVLKDGVNKAFQKIDEMMGRIHLPNALAKDAVPTMKELYEKTNDPQVISYARKELKALGYPMDVMMAFDQAITAAHRLKLGQTEAAMNRSNVIPFNRGSQRGAVGDLNRNKRLSQTGAQSQVVGAPPPKPVDMVANERRRLMAKNFGKNLGLDEFDTIRDKSEALTLSTGAKDIGKDIGQKSLVSGINMETALSNNPMLKFARTVYKDARSYADKFSRTFVTDNDKGLSPLWSKMKGKERIAAMEALMEGDRRKTPVTENIMNRLEFTDAQKQFVHTYYSANAQLLKDGNAALAKLGLSPVDERTGHFPGIFSGAYKTVVFNKREGGRVEVLGILATDTVAQMKAAKQYALEHYPKAQFVEKKRASLAGSRYGSNDIFSGMNDVMEILGKDDPKFAEIKEILDGAVKRANNALFSFNVHELHKKGVFGNEGNKPWMSPERNATDAFKALVHYFEDGSMHHALQVPLKEVRDVLTADETQHMPNARKYLEAYTKKVTGDDLNSVGRALNTLLDAPFEYVPAISFGLKGAKVGFGVGPAVPMKIVGTIKNNMSQLYMGWLNWMFTASQMVQPLQTGTPFMQVIASRLHVNPMEIPASMAKGGIQFALAATEHMSKTKIDALDPFHREAFQHALDRGMYEFSEMEKAHQGTQNVVTRNKDRIAEINMKLGEQATRTPMFMMFADLLHKQGMETSKAFDIAENLTQASMIDYHQWERPMIYSKMGIAGGLAAGLTTFKHGYASQLAYLSKQAVMPARQLVQGKDGVFTEKRGNRQYLPIIAALGGMLIFNGITGTPFYDELNTIYRNLTNQFGGEAKTIREDFLANSPDWANSGVVSAASGLNLQGKFSSADMVPDNSFKSVSPHLDGAWKIAKGAYDMATQRDAQGVRNFATAATPSGWRGVTENALSKDEDGNLIGKDGLPSYQRTPDEWMTRALTGQRSEREALDRSNVWDARMKERADTDERAKIHKEYERRIVNNNMDDASQAKLEENYQKRKGDVRELLSLWQKAALEKSKTEKERLEGNPSTMNGVNRWEYFNK